MYLEKYIGRPRHIEFQVLFDNKVSLICLRSVGMQTEQAYMDLMEQEESRGFTRLVHLADAA